MLGVSRDTIDKATNLKLVISPKHCPQLIRKYFSIDVSRIQSLLCHFGYLAVSCRLKGENWISYVDVGLLCWVALRKRGILGDNSRQNRASPSMNRMTTLGSRAARRYATTENHLRIFNVEMS